MTAIAKIGTTSYNTVGDAVGALLSGQTLFVTRNGAGAEVTAAFTKTGSYKTVGVPDAKGGIPKLQLDRYTRPAFGKALLNIEYGDHEISYLHLDGTTVDESNGAAIRVNEGAGAINIHHVRLTNNENGILSGLGNAMVALSDSVLDGNGKASDSARRGYSHNVYAGGHKAFSATRVSFVNSAYGHDVKSRALTTTLSQVLCQGAAQGRELDLPNGGVLQASDCLFYKPASATQNNLIDIGAEGITDGRAEKYEFANCQFHNDVPTDREVQYIMNRSTKEVVLIDPLFTGVAAAKDRKSTLVGNIRIVLTGGPLGPRYPVGGNPGTTSTAAVPDPTTTPTPTPTPTPAPTTPALPDAPVIPGFDVSGWSTMLAALVGSATQNTSVNITIKASPGVGLKSVVVSITHPAQT